MQKGKKVEKGKIRRKKDRTLEESQKESKYLWLFEFFSNFHLPPLKVVT